MSQTQASLAAIKDDHLARTRTRRRSCCVDSGSTAEGQQKQLHGASSKQAPPISAMRVRSPPPPTGIRTSLIALHDQRTATGPGFPRSGAGRTNSKTQTWSPSGENTHVVNTQPGCGRPIIAREPQDSIHRSDHAAPISRAGFSLSKPKVSPSFSRLWIPK
jgi:hypothetical protein